LWIQKLLQAPTRGTRGYFFFFAGAAFFFAAGFAAFFVAFFIDRFSLTSDLRPSSDRSCDSYIKLFEKKVKRKVKMGPSRALPAHAPQRSRHEMFWAAMTMETA
jgi:hypothetical protein